MKRLAFSALLLAAMSLSLVAASGPSAKPEEVGVSSERLQRISQRWCIPPLPANEVEQVIKRAVLFSNKDIDSFAEPDTGRFLDNTWKLLPETNPYHLVPNIYTIRSYRHALQQMQQFLCRLNPDDVFSQYHVTPPEAYRKACPSRPQR